MAYNGCAKKRSGLRGYEQSYLAVSQIFNLIKLSNRRFGGAEYERYRPSHHTSAMSFLAFVSTFIYIPNFCLLKVTISTMSASLLPSLSSSLI